MGVRIIGCGAHAQVGDVRVEDPSFRIPDSQRTYLCSYIPSFWAHRYTACCAGVSGGARGLHQTMELMRLLVSLLFLMVCRAQGPAANLSVTFREDTKHLQHAIFDFTWTPPPGKLALTKCASLVSNTHRFLIHDSRH